MKLSYWTFIYNVWLLAVLPCLNAYLAPMPHHAIGIIPKTRFVENEDSDNVPNPAILRIDRLGNELNNPTFRRKENLDDSRRIIPGTLRGAENKTIELNSSAQTEDIDATRRQASETSPELNEKENASESGRMLVARLRTKLGQTNNIARSGKRTFLRIKSRSKLRSNNNLDSNSDEDIVRRVILKVSPDGYKHKFINSGNIEGGQVGSIRFNEQNLIAPTQMKQIKWGIHKMQGKQDVGLDSQFMVAKQVQALWPHQGINSQYDINRSNQVDISNQGQDISELPDAGKEDNVAAQLETNPPQQEQALTIHDRTPDSDEGIKELKLQPPEILGNSPTKSSPLEISKLEHITEIINRGPSLEVLPIVSPENQSSKNQLEQQIHVPTIEFPQTSKTIGPPGRQFLDVSIKPNPYSSFTIPYPPNYLVPEIYNPPKQDDVPKIPYFHYPQTYPTKPELQVNPEGNPLKDILLTKMCQVSYNNFLKNWRIILDYFGLNKQWLDEAESRKLSRIFEIFFKLNVEENLNKMPIDDVLYKLVTRINQKVPISGQIQYIHETPNGNYFDITNNDHIRTPGRSGSHYEEEDYYNLIANPLILKNPKSDTDLEFDESPVDPESPESKFYWKLLEEYLPRDRTPVDSPYEIRTETPLNFQNNEEPVSKFKTPDEIINDILFSFEQPGGVQTAKKKFSIIMAEIIDYLTKHHRMTHKQFKPIIVNIIMSALSKPKQECEKKKYLLLIEHLKHIIDYYLSQNDCEGAVYRSDADKPQFSKDKLQKILRSPLVLDVLNEMIRHKQKYLQN